MSENNKINVCLACDDNYARHAGVVIASILANANSEDELTFYVLDGGILDENKNRILELKSIKNCDINFIKIDESMFEDYKKVKTHSYITLATYYRLKLPTLLPDVSRVIYFDCDFVINSSLKDLFNKNLGDLPLAGVRDINKRELRKNHNYVNAGMLVMDLDNLKKQNIETQFLEWTKEHIDTIKLGDQEIINEVLKDRILIVEDEWNVQSSNFTNRSSYTNKPRAIHFVAKKKPWHYGSFSYHRALYFKYLQLTPWKMSDKDYHHWTVENQVASVLGYVKYRPIFFLRPRFYEALAKTYLPRLIKKKEDEYYNYYSFLGLLPICKVQKNSKDRYFIYAFGMKFTIRKNKLSKAEIKRLNKNYEHKGMMQFCPKVKSRISTLKALVNSNKSLTRFGDGEFNLILGEDLPFQRYSETLADKMRKILVSDDENIMVAIPDMFDLLEQYTEDEGNFWRKYIVYHRAEINPLLDLKKQYYDTEVSRPYHGVKDKTVCKKYFQDFKQVWEKKNLVIVEGEASRLGVGNDLFDNCNSIKRILCPAKDAYSKYEEVLGECLKQSKDDMFILALGPTATVLAYDLAKNGYRALDLGHLDIEYEWFRMGAKKKVAIKNKYVNEAKGGRVVTALNNSNYEKEIIKNLSIGDENV